MDGDRSRQKELDRLTADEGDDESSGVWRKRSKRKDNRQRAIDDDCGLRRKETRKEKEEGIFMLGSFPSNNNKQITSFSNTTPISLFPKINKPLLC